VKERELEWASWMKAANAGDRVAYRRLLGALSAHLRAIVRRQAVAYALGAADVEDVVQETLLAIHLKRGTWDPGQPVGPWVAAIARNKTIDSLRRRGRRIDVPIDDFVDVLPADEKDEQLSPHEADRLLQALKGRQHDVVRAISLEGADIKETAARYGMSEGAVRVALHRGLASLAAAYRSFRA
jgi:RNA polymerase sigma-70 factor (ECF subfamily)